MTQRPIPQHLIEQAWEIYSTFMIDTGAPPPDKLAWLGGFSAAIGVLVGTVDVGIPEGTPTRDVVERLIGEELPRYRAELAALEEQARRRSN